MISFILSFYDGKVAVEVLRNKKAPFIQKALCKIATDYRIYPINNPIESSNPNTVFV